MRSVAARPLAEMEAALDYVRAAPLDSGTLELIVIRPGVEEREILEEGQLDLERGLVGDNWGTKPSQSTGKPKPEAQVTVMSSRAAALVADGEDRAGWAQAGDQLYVDLDLSEANLTPGSKLAIGTAVLEVTQEPHLGCGKFIKRFGADALKLVNSATGRKLRLRGVNTRVAVAGTVRTGDEVRKV
jgi:MOSC domain-containing protein YiiM